MNKKEYLEKAKELEEKEPAPLVEVPMPSGAVFKHIPFDFTQYAAAAQFPLHLIGKLRSAKNAPQKELSEEELERLGIASMRIVADITLTKLVEPKVTTEETEDSITVDQIHPKDWKAWNEYIMSGGQASRDSFRSKSARR